MSGKKNYAQVDVRQRMLVLARRVYEGKVVTSEWIERTFGITGRSARTDLAMLAMYLPCDQRRLARPTHCRRGGRRKTVRLARHVERVSA